MDKVPQRLIVLLVLCLTISRSFSAAVTDFFELSATDIYGKEVLIVVCKIIFTFDTSRLFQVKFAEFEGNVVLVVNVASQCGFTDGHYKGLKRLHDILGFNNKLAILGKRDIAKIKAKLLHN